MRFNLFIAASLLCVPLATMAQSPDSASVQRTVVVENEYTPIINDAQRVSALPSVTQPQPTQRTVEYVETTQPATAIPADTMQAYTTDYSPEQAKPGYIRAGYGLGGRMDLKANYLFALSSADRLCVDLNFDGRESDVNYLDGSGDWESRYFQTHAELNYTHRFNRTSLDLAGHFDLTNLNFQPASISSKQKFTAGGLHIALASNHDASSPDVLNQAVPLAFKAETNLLLFQRQQDLIGYDLKETLIRTKAEAVGQIDNEQRVGIAFQMDNAFYGLGETTVLASGASDDESVTASSSNGIINPDNDLESHTDLFFNPFYGLTRQDGAFSLRVGAHVDFALGFGTAIRVAPDVEMDYHFGRYADFYLKAIGGKRMNDFNALARLSTYAQLLTQTEATYEPLNASIGIKASPTEGLWLHLFGGYQILRDDLVEGDYSTTSTADNSSLSSDEGNDSAEANSSLSTSSATYFYHQNTQNAYVGAEVTYAYKDLFRLSASALYRAWTSDWDDDDESTSGLADDPALAYKPQLTAQVELGFRPLPPLWVEVGYNHVMRQKINGVKADAVSNLYLHATCELFNGVGLYVHAENLLDQTFAYYRAYAAPGIAVYGGLSFRF